MPFFSHLNPVPSFPGYTGPYTVGSQEVEIPVSELSSPSSAPDASITTVNFRIFYPCDPDKAPKHMHWLPKPQTQYFQAYAKFLNAGPWLASFLSYLPIFRLIFYTTIPASQDAKLLSPPKEVGRWPVMVFSHGLGGTKNAYSHLTGSLASHGMVVIAPDHRDGSAPLSFIRNGDGSSKEVDYVHLPHRPPPEILASVEDGRNHQLSIRCWELGLIHDALIKIDCGEKITNLATNSLQDLSGLKSNLDVHAPGTISWSGHSFGASTMVQFVKSVFYPAPQPIPSGYKPLYTPSTSSAISQQITPSSPVTLLDLWAVPLFISSTSWLWDHPLPAHQSADGSPPLAILSEAFFRWNSNLQDTKRTISPSEGEKSQVTPHLFYAIDSAHLSQSDFGPLFPWATRRMFKAAEPIRTLHLNVRAILENLRGCGIKVGDTSAADMELDDDADITEDHKILATDGSVKGWIAISLDGKDGPAGPNGHAIEANSPGEAVHEGEVMKHD